MKKILVPTDFSTQAENALKVAAQLAKKHHCAIHLLHIIELPLQKVDPVIANNDLPEAIFFMKLARKHFETLLKNDYLKDITIHEHVEFNDIFKSVFHVCEKHKIDLIIMGSKGTSGLTEMLIGSNTEKVVRTSEVPVLVIKKEHETFNINDFVFASDFNDESIIPYTKATDFAKLLKAKIHLLMVNTPNKFMTTLEAEERMLNFTKNINFKNFIINIYNDETVESGIMNYAKSINADLIGMSTHGRQGISHFFNGSISEDLVNHAKRPVMTFKI
ncbi:universal stress protein [Confluentibacter flavum]|uniref:Universal stress protein UspA n=1 Tax=Confluentibacter flavum TaxID=1909700 RepID=A0A2N3HH97_9FLAO|nr:universal stress protein [Confluentibacter flavum]PKQ44345.1 universal stress protein UspA [Confluentibacter flavum]